MQNATVGMLWPTSENFDRFVTVCVDEQEKTVAAWHARANAKIEKLKPLGIVVEKLEFDVDAFVAWAKTRGTSINSEARQLYAAELAAKRRGLYQASK